LGTPGEQNSKFDVRFESNTASGDERSEYGLIQNYPNPFSTSTNIAYKIENPSQVEIRIYNILGQRIRTLLNQEQIPNEYDLIWDGKNDRGVVVSSGVYVYILFINYELAEIKKMVKLSN
jgi:flagellar hook assembly protein FlgD